MKIEVFAGPGYVGVWSAEAPGQFVEGKERNASGSLMKTIKLHDAAISALTLTSDATTLAFPASISFSLSHFALLGDGIARQNLQSSHLE